MDRRNFLLNTSALGLTITNGNLCFANQENKNDKAVIYIFLSGGATHIETFNPILEDPLLDM